MCSFYSGTVAGAREAYISGVPAISISLDWYIMIQNFFYLVRISYVLVCELNLTLLIFSTMLMFHVWIWFTEGKILNPLSNTYPGLR